MDVPKIDESTGIDRWLKFNEKATSRIFERGGVKVLESAFRREADFKVSLCSSREGIAVS